MIIQKTIQPRGVPKCSHSLKIFYFWQWQFEEIKKNFPKFSLFLFLLFSRVLFFHLIFKSLPSLKEKRVLSIHERQRNFRDSGISGTFGNTNKSQNIQFPENQVLGYSSKTKHLPFLYQAGKYQNREIKPEKPS